MSSFLLFIQLKVTTSKTHSTGSQLFAPLIAAAALRYYRNCSTLHVTTFCGQHPAGTIGHWRCRGTALQPAALQLGTDDGNAHSPVPVGHHSITWIHARVIPQHAAARPPGRPRCTMHDDDLPQDPAAQMLPGRSAPASAACVGVLAAVHATSSLSCGAPNEHCGHQRYRHPYSSNRQRWLPVWHQSSGSIRGRRQHLCNRL